MMGCPESGRANHSDLEVLARTDFSEAAGSTTTIMTTMITFIISSSSGVMSVDGLIGEPNEADGRWPVAGEVAYPGDYEIQDRAGQARPGQAPNGWISSVMGRTTCCQLHTREVATHWRLHHHHHNPSGINSV